MRRPPPPKRCAIASCRETLPPFARLSLCPSCRVAAECGAMVAFVVACLLELVRRLF
jgi:hypothetical protein